MDSSDSKKEDSTLNNDSKLKDFEKAIQEFLDSIVDVFPEVSEKVEKCKNMESDVLLEYCKKVYPERFFDILSFECGEIFKI